MEETTFELDGDEWSASRLGRFTLGETGTGSNLDRRLGGLVSGRKQLLASVRNRILAASPVARRYTERSIATLAPY
jgi:hypothetical protein